MTDIAMLNDQRASGGKCEHSYGGNWAFFYLYMEYSRIDMDQWTSRRSAGTSHINFGIHPILEAGFQISQSPQKP